MTIFYPDYSSYQGQANPAGSPAIVAKATEGNYYTDADYQWYKDQAAKLGVPFSGYHFLKSNIDPAVQAQYYFKFAGTVPCMLDVETEGSSKPTVDQVVAFMSALHGLGGRVWGVYFPRWYWGEVGGDLSRVEAAGAVIIASEYRSFDDNNWPAPYGGITAPIWQYTSSYNLNGTLVDYNAFKGTASQLAALINGDNVALTTDEIQAIARAVYEYGEESILLNGQTLKNVSLGNLAHGSWVATNHTLADKLDQILAKLSTLATGTAPSAQAVAAETLAELKAKL